MSKVKGKTCTERRCVVSDKTSSFNMLRSCFVFPCFTLLHNYLRTVTESFEFFRASSSYLIPCAGAFQYAVSLLCGESWWWTTCEGHMLSSGWSKYIQQFVFNIYDDITQCLFVFFGPVNFLDDRYTVPGKTRTKKEDSHTDINVRRRRRRRRTGNLFAYISAT